MSLLLIEFTLYTLTMGFSILAYMCGCVTLLLQKEEWWCPLFVFVYRNGVTCTSHRHTHGHPMHE